MEDFLAAPQYAWARTIFERGMGAIYFTAFLSAFNQFPALLGERGLLPVPDFVAEVPFRSAPSIFHWRYSDWLLRWCCLLGMALSLLYCFGIMAHAPLVLHVSGWLLLYGLYLSLVNVGQDFYGFGWETMLLEAGFFTAFMGNAETTPSWIPIIILRWMLIRTELGAGLIKLRGDRCWRNLTCLYYHHETQPLPNPLSRLFHHSPKWVHRFGVLFSHFCQLVAPLGLLLPAPVAPIAGAFLIFHQLILIVSGNYSWLNWLTVVLGVLAFPQSTWTPMAESPLWFTTLQLAAGGLCVFLSYRPLLNLFSPNQYMNYCWNRWHLVGAYGAFGSVTKERYEIIIEGRDESGKWREYGFRGKPVELDRTPPVVAPYHLRLDWMIWFLPFTVRVTDQGIIVRGYSIWFLRLVKKLLQNDAALLKLFRKNPFTARPPVEIRARFYQYHFTALGEKHVWRRELKGEFLPEVSLEELRQPGI